MKFKGDSEFADKISRPENEILRTAYLFLKFIERSQHREALIAQFYGSDLVRRYVVKLKINDLTITLDRNGIAGTLVLQQSLAHRSIYSILHHLAGVFAVKIDLLVA